jgi:hypothetical protein
VLVEGAAVDHGDPRGLLQREGDGDILAAVRKLVDVREEGILVAKGREAAPRVRVQRAQRGAREAVARTARRMAQR